MGALSWCNYEFHVWSLVPNCFTKIYNLWTVLGSLGFWWEFLMHNSAVVEKTINVTFTFILFLIRLAFFCLGTIGIFPCDDWVLDSGLYSYTQDLIIVIKVLRKSESLLAYSNMSCAISKWISFCLREWNFGTNVLGTVHTQIVCEKPSLIQCYLQLFKWSADNSLL